jgi:hypothetical protein
VPPATDAGSTAPIVLGTHVYPASGAAADRMQRALDGWAALPGIRLVNLQFADDPNPVSHPAFETRLLLREDSLKIAGAKGPRKPIVRELLDHLCAAAQETNVSYFGFSNADILISGAALEKVVRSGRDAVIFSRMDIDAATGATAGEFLSGQDTLFLTPHAYRRVRRRLRSYIVGEMPWDVIYTSILLTHVRATLVNRGDDCRHVAHETIWVDSPFARHGWRLAHQDWTYFARWYRYYNPAKALRERGGSAAEEDALRERAFGPLTLGERLAGAYRMIRYSGLFG